MLSILRSDIPLSSSSVASSACLPGLAGKTGLKGIEKYFAITAHLPYPLAVSDPTLSH
jgi:hypothetical protein